MLNAFTVDVEDYFQVGAFADRIPTSSWDDFDGRVDRNTRSILDLLDKHQVRGTFFILGWTAQRYPDLVRDIQRGGHEIGSHSYWHQLIYEMTPEEFADDLRQSCRVIEEITGEPVRLFRAPSFSITSRSLWALDLLAESGIEYDSSIFPVHHDRYGIPDAEPFPYRLDTHHGGLWEFPPSVYRVANRVNLPVAGGGYFRLYPAAVTLGCIKRINRSGHPFMFYIHPWEVDPDQPRLPCGLRSRFRHYQNLGSTYRKLDRLLSEIEFGTMTDALSASTGQCDSVATSSANSTDRPRCS